ncbi:MAG TPA: hypothetical protein VGR28_00440 [Candidatus Thermoplasmatota archaeon]|jgi:hypothetical protein|nr:hypothetical protein [Candidatus Thermoplasmatota archaeon]
MRLVLVPALLALAIALAPAAQACHVGLGLRGSGGVVGASLAELQLPFPLCEGPVTLGVAYAGAGHEDVAATLDLVGLDGCVHIDCGGSDPLAVLMTFTAADAGLALVGAFDYPHWEAGFVFAGTVHDAPAAFAAFAT